jgi:polyketide cyclase/dehydrase/lipid transport protein
MFPCERVELDFIDNAAFRFSNSVDLAITPEQLFEVLADADSWPRWAKVITTVTWTSPEPRGVGTTRTVYMRGGIVGNVGAPPACGGEFLAWEPFSHMAFRFNECSMRAVAAFAEDYRVESTPGGWRLTWTVAQKAAGPSRFTMAIGRPVVNLGYRWFLANLRRYAGKRFATAVVSTGRPRPHDGRRRDRPPKRRELTG